MSVVLAAYSRGVLRSHHLETTRNSYNQSLDLTDTRTPKNPVGGDVPHGSQQYLAGHDSSIGQRKMGCAPKQKLVADAQQEAKERIWRIRQRRLYINKVQSAGSLTFPTPSINISVESPCNIQEALLDSGADANIMPTSVYNKLCNKATSELTAHLYNFQKQLVSTQGMATIQIFYEGVSSKAEFQLVDCQGDTIIILNPWETLDCKTCLYAEFCLVEDAVHNQWSSL